MPRQDPFKRLPDGLPEILAHRPGQEPKRDRSWDETNPAISLRIRAEDADRLGALAGSLGVSRDALGRALLWAALDAAEAGGLRLEVSEVQTEGVDRLGRPRLYTRRIVAPAWDSERTANSGACGASFDAASNA